MKKTIVLTFLMVFILLSVSCDNETEALPKALTFTQAADYLSSIDGLFQLGSDYYLMPSSVDTADIYWDNWYEIPMSDKSIYLSRWSIDGKKINFVGSQSTMAINVVNFTRFFSVQRENSIAQIPLSYETLKDENALYLGRQPNNIAFFLEKYNIKTSPDWSEWLDYDIQYSIETWDCSMGKGYGFWYNPLTEKCEECIYLRELENKTEIYVIYQELSLFHGRFCYYPFIMSEELYQKIENELGDAFKEKNYKKGSVLEFYNWYSGGYTEEVSDLFKNVKQDVYYPFYEGYCHFSSLLADLGYNVPEIFIDDMKKLGIDYDNIKVNIVKITVPHDGTIQDIFWELVG